MDTPTAIVLGAALVVVGVLAYKALQPPPAPPPVASSGGGLLGPLGQLLSTRLGEALDGEREWW